MASIPGSPPSGLLPPLLPPLDTPPTPDSSSSSPSPPPPSNDSSPPPTNSPPPAASSPPNSPPPSPPNSPPPSPPNSPPPSPPNSPPPSPPNSPPPSSLSNSNSQPPPSNSPSPPPPSNSPSLPPFSPPPSSPSDSTPPSFPPPSPADSSPRQRSTPAASPTPTPPSPPAPPGTSQSPPTPAGFNPPSVNSPSPSAPRGSTSPSAPTTDSSPSTGSAPRPPSNSGSSGSNVSVNPVPNSPPENDQSVKTGIAVGVVAGVVVLGLVVALLFMCRRRKKHTRYNSVYMMPSPYASSPASGTSFMKPNDSSGGGGGNYSDFSPDSAGIGNSKTWFSYEELSAASGGFATQNILGRGGFGCVYKGCLQDGREVAIKKLKDNSGQGDREFKAEVEIISRVHHRYLVSLVGYCITDSQRLLIYEFVPNGTLHYHLHNPSKPAMSWKSRVKVACGSARGLAYLHEDCHPKIIHRDIKSANILIDNNFEAKVADFGLAKVAQELELNTHVSTRVMGTFGYMAPEYASSGKLTEKSDVFSFGVVLLEIITGRRPVDETRPLGDESLVEWARPLMTEALDNQNFDELADPRLQGNYDRGEMFRMIEAAAACVRHSATKRPKMSQVVRALNSIDEQSDISNGMKPGQSGIYDSREQSAQIKLFQRMAFGSQEFSAEQSQGMSQSSWSGAGRSGIGGSSGQV